MITPTVSDNPILWQPTPHRINSSNMLAFMQRVSAHQIEKSHLTGNAPLFTYAPDKSMTENYANLHHYSVTDIEGFWREVWDYSDIVATSMGINTVINADNLPSAKWFPDARLNYAENLLHAADSTEAIVFCGEDKVRRRLTRAEVANQTAAISASLRAMGVGEGDCVAAYMPNMPETLIFMLAASSIGAIFSSASPDFGVQGVMDRFAQIKPKVLLTVEGYYYNGKTINIVDKVADISTRLGAECGLQHTIMVSYTSSQFSVEGIHAPLHWTDLQEQHCGALLPFAQLPFDHPLFIMFSSGTTGVPKCIVHSAGGTLLQHLKEHRLHGDLKDGDRIFFFTTCGWMMWNWLMSAMATRATLLLYDGSPLYQGGHYLFDFLSEEKCTHLGTSAKFIDAIAKNKLSPKTTHRLDSLRTIFSTGSTLTPEGFDFVYQHIKSDVCLSSISGGTDIVSCFVLGNPTVPVRRGEIQCRGLGMAVEVWDEDGKPAIGKAGELVCVRPFPSMPIGFLHDDTTTYPYGKRYHEAYFDVYKNIWCHGDYSLITSEGGVIIYGRSDATLNPGGVRIGTAEIYRQVEKLDEVVESLVVGQLWQGDERVVLFVRLREGLILDDTIKAKIVKVIKDNATPRHVPALILSVDDIPRTRSGKIVELAVKNILHNRPVKNLESLANPEALQAFANMAVLKPQP